MDSTATNGKGFQVDWGTIVAGAAIAVGVVLVGQAVMDSAIEPVFTKIGEIITEMTSKLSSFDNLNQPGTAFKAIVSPEMAKNIGGALLLGSGAGYMLCRSTPDNSVDPQALAAIQQASTTNFAEKEQMRAVQGLMKARMAAFSPEYMAQAQAGRAMG